MALERLELLINASSGAAVKDIKAVGDASEGASLKQQLLSKESNIARTALDSVGLSGVSMGAGLSAAAVGGGALVGVGLAKFAIDAASTTADLAGEIRDFQRVAGTGAEESSRFVAALDDLGVSTDKGASAVFKLSKNAETNKQGLADLGIEIAKNKDGTTDLTGTLLNAADAFVATNDQATKNAIAFTAFGKAGKDLIPVLEQGRAGLQAFFDGADEGHQIFTQQQLDNAREYDLALNNLGDTFRGLQIEVGQKAIPVVTGFANAFSNIVGTADKAQEATSGFYGTAVKGAAENAPVIGTFVKMGEGLADLTGIFDSGSDASSKYTDAQTKLKDAQTQAFNLAAQGKTHTSEYKDAMNDAKAASEVLTGAQQRLADSMETTGTKALDAQTKLLGVAGATLNVQGNTLATADAVDRYNATLYANGVAGDTSEQANRRLEQAHLAVQASAIKTIQSAGDLAVANYHGSDASEAAKIKADAQRAAYDYLVGTIPGLREQLQGTAADISAIPTQHHTVVTADVEQALAQTRRAVEAFNQLPNVSNINYGGFGGTRAAGGPVSANRPYIVGEQGPELFVPSSSGSIVPNGGMGGDIVILLDGEVIARNTTARMNRAGGPQITSRAVI
jgi:hypothetical protein